MPDKLTDDKIVELTKIWIREFERFEKHYNEIELGYNYLAGVQYTDAQLKWYESVRRPASVFNLIFPQFNAVIGDFILNDQKNRVFAQPGGTAQMSSVVEDLLDNIDHQNDSKSVLSELALSGLIKQGYVYSRYSNERELDGSVVFNTIDEFEILFDSDARDYFLDDAKFIARSLWMGKEQLLNTYPRHAKEINSQLVRRYDLEDWNDIDDEYYRYMTNRHVTDTRRGKYRVIEFHEMKYEDVETAVNSITGQIEPWTLTGRKADLFLRMNPGTSIIQNKARIKRITTFIPAINYGLSSEKADIQDGTFDIIPFAAYNYGKRSIDNFGLFKNSIGPQDDFNSWMNKSSALIDKTIDPGYTYRPDALKNPKQVELYGSSPGVNFQVKDEEIISEAIKENRPPVYPFSAERLGGERGELLQKIAGITPNMLGGQDTSQENASLFAQRVKQSKVALQVMNNNFSRTKRRLYNKMIRLIQENYDNRKYFLVSNPKTGAVTDLTVMHGPQIINDLRLGRYQVLSDDQERTPTARFSRFLQKTEVVQTVQALYGGQPIPAENMGIILSWWLKESGLGDIDTFVSAFTNAAQQNQQMQQAMQEAQAQSEIDERNRDSAFRDVNSFLDTANKLISSENGVSAEGTSNSSQAA